MYLTHKEREMTRDLVLIHVIILMMYIHFGRIGLGNPTELGLVLESEYVGIYDVPNDIQSQFPGIYRLHNFIRQRMLLRCRKVQSHRGIWCNAFLNRFFSLPGRFLLGLRKSLNIEVCGPDTYCVALCYDSSRSFPSILENELACGWFVRLYGVIRSIGNTNPGALFKMRYLLHLSQLTSENGQLPQAKHCIY